MAAVACLACAPVACLGHEETCEPAFYTISRTTVEYQWKDVHSTINGAVIGCAAELSTITEQEREKLVALLRQVLIEVHYDLIAESRAPEFRAALAARVNSILGRKVATDVFLHAITFSES